MQLLEPRTQSGRDPEGIIVKNAYCVPESETDVVGSELVGSPTYWSASDFDSDLRKIDNGQRWMVI